MAEIFGEEIFLHLNPRHLQAFNRATLSQAPDYYYRIKVSFINLQKTCNEVFSSNSEINSSLKEIEQKTALENTKLGQVLTEKILFCIAPEYLMDNYDFIYKRAVGNVNIEYIQGGFESLYDTLNDASSEIFSRLLIASFRNVIQNYIAKEMSFGEQIVDPNSEQIDYILENLDKLMQLVSKSYTDEWIHSFYKNSLGGYYDSCTSVALIKMRFYNLQKFAIIPKVLNFINQELFRSGQTIPLVCLKNKVICNSAFLQSEQELGRVLAIAANDYFEKHSQPVFFGHEDMFYQKYLVGVYTTQSSRQLGLAA